MSEALEEVTPEASVPLPPPSHALASVAFGIAACGGLVALYFAYHLLFDSTDWMFDPASPLGITSHNRAHLVVAVLIGFLLTTIRHERRAWPQDVALVWQGTARPPSELPELLADPLVYRCRVLLVMGIGAIAGLAIIPATSNDPLFFLDAEHRDAHLLWNAVTTSLVFALMARVSFESFMSARVTNRVTRAVPEVDLLDRRAFAPFAAIGLRHSLYWVLGTSVTSLLLLDLQRSWPLIPVLVFTLSLAVFLFLAPALAVRSRLRAAKQAELAHVRGRIAVAREAALAPTSEAGAAASASLPGLLAYESRIESVREWPYDLPVLLRFGAVLLLATGSWVGGALVERLLGTVLD